MLKFSMHVHTKGRSPCAQVEPQRIVELYKAKNYGGIVVTDHYVPWIFEQNNCKTDLEKVEFFLKGYRETKKWGDKLKLKVFLGMELNLTAYNTIETHPAVEFLIYGLSEEFVYEHPRMYDLSAEELFKLTSKNNMLMTQAHPFRAKSKCSDPEFMHGVEVFNGNQRHNSFNSLAYTFADKNKLIKVVSDDFHEEEDLEKGAMLFPDDTDTIKKLVEYIKAGKSEIFIQE